MATWVHKLAHFLAEDYFMSDEFLGTFVPIVVYWVYSGMYMMLDSLDNYRLHPRKEAELKNSVSKTQVVIEILMHQTVQTTIGILFFVLAGDQRGASSSDGAPPSLIIVACQFFIGMIVTDTYQYFTHRYLHQNKFLYRHVHSVHHRVVVTHAFGALYGHPLWDGIIDTVGGGLGFLVSGMSPRVAIFFYSFCVIKAIDDHSGMWLPGNPFHLLFSNNSATHDFHHQLAGGKYNFSQPFFTTWDKILGTDMPVSVEKREDGPGFVIKTEKDQ